MKQHESFLHHIFTKLFIYQRQNNRDTEASAGCFVTLVLILWQKSIQYSSIGYIIKLLMSYYKIYRALALVPVTILRNFVNNLESLHNFKNLTNHPACFFLISITYKTELH